jgi:glycerophosphoryl diester phosphodiesterase
LCRGTYLCCEDFAVLTEVAPRTPDVLLVDSSRLSKLKDGPERRLSTLASLGVVALNMHHSDWNGGLVTLAHRFDRLAFAWDAQFDHTLTGLLRMGVDAVYSDWVDRMVDAARAL